MKVGTLKAFIKDIPDDRDVLVRQDRLDKIAMGFRNVEAILTTESLLFIVSDEFSEPIDD